MLILAKKRDGIRDIFYKILERNHLEDRERY
jgi:hypothetical protein